MVREVRGLPGESAPPELCAGVMDDVRAADRPARSRAVRIGRSLLAAAAALLIVLTMFLLTQQENSCPVVGSSAKSRLAREAAVPPHPPGGEQAVRTMPSREPGRTERAVRRPPDRGHTGLTAGQEQPAARRQAPAGGVVAKRHITVLTNDIARARRDVLRIAAEIVRQPDRAAPARQLRWTLTRAHYQSLLAKLEAEGYQLERGASWEDEGERALANTRDGEARRAGPPGGPMLHVAVRFRLLPGQRTK